MGRPSKLDDAAIDAALADLDGWERRGDALARELRFPDFAAAFGFMSAVALEAERRDHHPDWRNVYARVEVEWSTHDAGGITQLDVDLALACDAIATRFGVRGD